MYLSKAVELFLEYLKVQDKSPLTIGNYRYYLEMFNNYLSEKQNKQPDIEEITPDDLEKYLYNELGETIYSSSARHNMITAFKSLYSYCFIKGYCKINTGKLINNVRIETKERASLSEIEFRKLVRYIHSHTAQAVIHTLFYTGLRIRECLKLTLDDVDLINDTIQVREGKGKKDRNIPISDRLKKLLQAYLKNDRHDIGTKNFFSSKSGKMCAQYVNRELRNAVKEAGLQKMVSCHVLRHSFASNLIDRGVNILHVQKLLGHNSIKTTTVYLHTSFDELQEAINLL